MDDLWGPIDPSRWRDTPVITGRAATEQDIAAGIAVFAVPTGSKPYEMDLPAFAVVHSNVPEDDFGPVVVIQAEIVDESVFLGLRPLGGGNGVCLLEQADFTVASPE